MREIFSSPKKRSGTEGFEPPSDGTKTRCLTAWPRPTNGWYDEYPILWVSCQPASLVICPAAKLRQQKRLDEFKRTD